MRIFFDSENLILILQPNSQLVFARVAELVDAADSKSAVRKDVLVRFQSRVLQKRRFYNLLFLFTIIAKFFFY
ncbi:MAG: hypothetical protein RIQ33_1833 [Bacteroidota bacterium]